MKEITLQSIKTFLSNSAIPFIATQPKLCVPIIIRMCQKMTHGIKFDDIKICDDLIIDGHHRYLSSLIMNFEIGMVKSSKTSATRPITWDKVELDELDWDTDTKIAHLNELDAKYNDLDIEFIRQVVLKDNKS